jgi:hypothetical protein
MIFKIYLLWITISASKPKKNVCRAVAQRIIKVASRNFCVTPVINSKGINSASAKRKILIGVKTLIGLKNSDSLVTSLKKPKKSVGFSDDFPSRL